MTQSRKGEYPIPPNAHTSKCTCGAMLIWTTTAKGRPMPLSASTVRTDEQGRKFALSHFANCPRAKQYRKPNPPAPSPNVVKFEDYAQTMDRLGLQAVESVMDQAGNIILATRNI